MDLLGRVCDALRDDDSAVSAVDIGALDRAVVQIGNAHVGPVDMTGSDIDRDAIREPAIGDNDLVVRAVRIHRVNSVATQFQENSRPERVTADEAFDFVTSSIVMVFPSASQLCLDFPYRKSDLHSFLAGAG